MGDPSPPNAPSSADQSPQAPQAPQRSRRGFAAMDPQKQREIARKGGRASGGRPENLRGVDRRAAGRKGGQAVVDKYGAGHMAEIGRKGGRSSGGFARMDPERQREIAARGGRAGAAGAAGTVGEAQPPQRGEQAATPGGLPHHVPGFHHHGTGLAKAEGSEGSASNGDNDSGSAQGAS